MYSLECDFGKRWQLRFLGVVEAVSRVFWELWCYGRNGLLWDIRPVRCGECEALICPRIPRSYNNNKDTNCIVIILFFSQISFQIICSYCSELHDRIGVFPRKILILAWKNGRNGALENKGPTTTGNASGWLFWNSNSKHSPRNTHLETGSHRFILFFSKWLFPRWIHLLVIVNLKLLFWH